MAQGEEMILLHDIVAISATLSFQGHQVFHTYSVPYLICPLLDYLKFNILKVQTMKNWLVLPSHLPVD